MLASYCDNNFIFSTMTLFTWCLHLWISVMISDFEPWTEVNYCSQERTYKLIQAQSSSKSP